jgi:hypothetical protein
MSRARTELQEQLKTSRAARVAPSLAKPDQGRPQAIADTTGRQATGETDTVYLAIKTLQSICQNADNPAGARAQAARTLLELAGALKTPPPDTAKPVSEMSLDEVEKRLAALTA